jgi:hypothetical protein
MMRADMRKLAWIALLFLLIDAGCSLDWTVPGPTPECKMCVVTAAKDACAPDYADCCAVSSCAACLAACTGPDCECAALSAQSTFIRARICFDSECPACTQPACGL